MDQFRPLGSRDIFGVLLPGVIVVFAAAYALWGVLALLQISVMDLLEQQFLVAVVLFVAAYLVGSLLRLYAANDVDSRSSEYLLKAWRKEYRARIGAGATRDFEKYRTELAKGEDISDIPDGFDDRLFDDWLWQVDEFPYHTRLNRLWRKAQGFCGVLDFFRENHKATMWSQSKWSRKSFFNYCKLVIIGNGGLLADEVNMAEGLTRFFAGTVVALGISTWLLVASVITQVLLIVALISAPKWGGKLAISVQWTSQGFCLVLTVVLIFVLQWICRRIVKRFRTVRFKEVETVYYAFYLVQHLFPMEAQQRENRPALQDTSAGQGGR